MPLGNLTSQFFANIYLNKLDHFIKHKLKAKYYIRYVDDFVILHNSKEKLEQKKKQIDNFLKKELKLELHKDKSKIKQLKQGINFLGFRIFPNHKLLRKKIIKKFKIRLIKSKKDKTNYDKIYSSFEGFLAHLKHANTYNLRKKLIKDFKQLFPKEISQIEINRYLKEINF
jgi:RNA-directed DNA polymerase